MANSGKNFFDKVASFEEALRKFEEALEQNQKSDTSRPLAQALDRMREQGLAPRPPWAGQPARPPQQGQWPAAPANSGWGRPNEDSRYQAANGPAIMQDDTGEGESLERADWLRRLGATVDAYNGDPDSEGQAGSEGQPDNEGPPSEGLAAESGEDRLSSLSTLSLMQGTIGQGSSSWWEDSGTGAASRGQAGALPPALAHLGRFKPMVQGIIWAEVLGKPVSKRHGRGRNSF